MAAYVARYANAFADVVAEFKLDPVAVGNQLNGFVASWDGSSQLREIFGDPSVPSVQKIAVLDAMNARLQLAPQARNLLAVLIDHDRINAVHEIVAEYERVEQARLGIAQAEVTTARELNEADKAELLALAGKLAKGQVEAKFSLDASILGGVVVRIGSTVYDGSVLGRIERLKEQLTQA